MQLDDLLSFFGAQIYLDSYRRRYTIMVLDLARRLAQHIQAQMKYLCRTKRPIDFAPEVQPMIQTPYHSSFPSGHAMEAFAMATTLHRLTSDTSLKDAVAEDALPFVLAHRIAVNRTVAGVHFPVDSWVGAWVGCRVGDALYSMAQGKEINVANLPKPTVEVDEETKDFILNDFKAELDQNSISLDPLEELKHVWCLALKEWGRDCDNDGAV
ncbi:MAG: phosphatase PAP2 family protein [Paracoccaceae bacterium]